MLSKFASLSAAAVALSALVDPAAAFWRLPCQGRLAVARMDPIVNPGEVSPHIHAIHGGESTFAVLFFFVYMAWGYIVHVLTIKLQTSTWRPLPKTC